MEQTKLRKGIEYNEKCQKMMFDRIMVCLVRKGSREFVDGMDVSSQLHALCSEQSVTVGLVKIPTVTRNGFLTNNGISTKCTYGLELQGHSRKYRFKNEENCEGTKIFFIQTYEKLCSVIFRTA